MGNEFNKFYLKDNTYIRYKVLGAGNHPLMLFHTIRNRLEYSYKVVDLLKKKYKIFLLDLPGFGDSPINSKTNYDEEFFTESVINLIKELKLKNIILAGESIGAVLPLTITFKIPKLVKKIFLFNPYNYDKYFGDGISRGNLFAKFIMFHISIPMLGNLFSALENKFILKNVLRGGFFDKNHLSDSYLDLLCTSLRKKGYVYHFRNVLSNFKSWVDSKRIYDQINKPVNLIYGSHDWATDTEKKETQTLLGIQEFETIENCGHFSFLEKPEKVAEILIR